MEYTEIAKSRGKLYACENQLYIQHSIKKGVRYLKCINEDCTATWCRYIGVLMSEWFNCRLGSAEFFNNYKTLYDWNIH